MYIFLITNHLLQWIGQEQNTNLPLQAPVGAGTKATVNIFQDELTWVFSIYIWLTSGPTESVLSLRAYMYIPARPLHGSAFRNGWLVFACSFQDTIVIWCMYDRVTFEPVSTWCCVWSKLTSHYRRCLTSSPIKKQTACSCMSSQFNMHCSS